MKLIALALAAAAALSCREPTAPTPPKIRTGGCTVYFKYWMDRADHSKGSITHSYTYLDTNSCPDSLWMVWHEDTKGVSP